MTSRMRMLALPMALAIWGTVWMADVSCWAVAGTTSSVAIVNGTVITAPAVEREMERLQRHQGDKGKFADEAEMARLRRTALDNLVARELLYQEAVRLNHTVEPAVVARELAELRNQFPSGGAYAQAVVAVGMDDQELREQVVHGLLVQSLIETVILPGTTVSDDEQRHYYESHTETYMIPARLHLSHILVTHTSTDDAGLQQAVRQRLAAIQAELDQGGDFAHAAKKYSDCESKSQGGDLGWFRAGQLSKPLEQVATQLGLGQVSRMVEDRYGYHFIKVIERQEARRQSYAEVAASVRKQIARDKGRKAVDAFVQKLRGRSRIDVREAL